MVFTSSTLVKLSLGTQYHIPILPCDTSLPALKVLFLDSIWFDFNQFATMFLPACPALEDLTIHHKTHLGGTPHTISNKTIKKLSVTYNDRCYVDWPGIISLNTPSVVGLYYDYARSLYLSSHFDSLAKATLELHFLDDDEADVTDLISGIRNVETLHLTSSAVEVISLCCKGEIPMFNNLVDLVFSSQKQGGRVLLPLLLERSPNLKNLVLTGLNNYTCKQHQFVGVRIPPDSLIKILSIMQCLGSVNELKMERLELLNVYVVASMDDPKKMKLTEDLLKLPAASSNLKIQVKSCDHQLTRQRGNMNRDTSDRTGSRLVQRGDKRDGRDHEEG